MAAVSVKRSIVVGDHEFHHNIVKAGSADYFDNVMTKIIVDNRTDA